MTVIPVIDLLQGHAVLARMGSRQDYRPIDSDFCRAGQVLPLVHHLHHDFASRLVYIADLDAIQGSGSNTPLIAEIQQEFPQLELWVDGGFRNQTDIDALRRSVAFRTVIGSESWTSGSPPRDGKPILSIDSDEHGLRDPSGVASDPGRRPNDLILMNLRRVGSQRGPDLTLLEYWRGQAPDARLYLAGGIRDRDDLDTAHAAGAAGVLLASAIHDGHIKPSDLLAFT